MQIHAPPDSPSAAGTAGSPSDEWMLSFERFELWPARKLLLDGGTPLVIGSRALELLALLAERAGEVVTKAELIQRAWPDTVVEEINLRVQLAGLRKTLGDGKDGARFLLTHPGRGYCLATPVRRVAARPPAAAHWPAPVRTNLPRRLTRVIGREEAVATLAAQLPSRRMITLVGPGGIGKTTLALAVSDRLLPRMRDGVVFVDLAPLAGATGVLGAVAAALGLAVGEIRVLEQVLDAVRHRQLLLVLDNCEHVVGAAAALTEALLQVEGELQILATSREPLRARGEWLNRVPPLGIPASGIPAGAGVSASQALAWSAVELFVERAVTNDQAFKLHDNDASAVLSLCQRLDGLPLAIELAAARVDTLGVRGLAARLDDRLHLFTNGLRTAVPRHRTLRALLDWSHELLPASAQAVLRRLAIFRGSFPLEAAVAVAGNASLGSHAVADGVVTLAEHSMLALDSDGDTVRYRLLEVTRAYALQELAAGGEHDEVARRHAAYLLQVYERVGNEPPPADRGAWLAEQLRRTDDLRAALDWAFGPSGDAELGVALTTAVAPLAFELAALHDFRARLEHALDVLDRLPGNRDAQASRLNTALGSLYNHILGPSPQMHAAYRRAFERASSRLDAKTMTPPLVGLWAQAYAGGDYPQARSLGLQLEDLADRSQDAIARVIGQRMQAQASHMLGDHMAARRLATAVLQYPQGRFPLVYGPSQTSVQITMRIVLARTDWLEGKADDAVRVADEAVRIAEDEHVFGECLALAFAACPIALWCGLTTRARALTDRLRALTRRYPSPYWQAWADGFDLALGAAAVIPPAFDPMRFETFMTFGATSVDGRTVERVESKQVAWCAPEVMRVQALAALRSADALRATKLLQGSLALAGGQGALSWELRSATTLAELLWRQGRAAEALAMLGAVISRFTQGRDTADVKVATDLLKRLQQAAD
jgi:predicted ATPase/DNA-binding winged helix-turn-helix (wHTH) protein